MLHVTILGETISYDPAPDVGAFLDVLRAAVADPTVDESAVLRLIYGVENPLLVHGVIPGRGAVGLQTLARPEYRVALDLLGQKQIALGRLDPEAARAAYRLTVREVVELLGISQQAVLRAINSRRLRAMRDGSTWLVDPASVQAYRVGGRGPQSAKRTRRVAS